MNIFAAIAADPNVHPAFRSAFGQVEQIRAPEAKDIRISLGTFHPQDASILEWSRYSFTRSQAARALRYCRAQGFLVEADSTGYVVSQMLGFERDELVYLARAA